VRTLVTTNLQVHTPTDGLRTTKRCCLVGATKPLWCIPPQMARGPQRALLSSRSHVKPCLITTPVPNQSSTPWLCTPLHQDTTCTLHAAPRNMRRGQRYEQLQQRYEQLQQRYEQLQQRQQQATPTSNTQAEVKRLDEEGLLRVFCGCLREFVTDNFSILLCILPRPRGCLECFLAISCGLAIF